MLGAYCVRNGAVISTGGRWLRGDLWVVGAPVKTSELMTTAHPLTWIMRANVCHHTYNQWKELHAEFDPWYQVWEVDMINSPATYILPHPRWFDYAGRKD